MADFNTYVVTFASSLFVVALTGLFSRWAIDFLRQNV